jgi:hypothetical protein
LDNREKLQRAEEEMSRRVAADPLRYSYTPHQFQLEAHENDADTLIVLGGNRSGKSHFAMAEAFHVVTGRQVWKRHRWIHNHGMGPVVWYIMPSIPTFKRAIEPKFWELLPKKNFIDWNKQDKCATFRTEQGVQGSLWFLSAEMRQIRLQGASVDLVIMDETPDEEVSKEARARIKDRDGRMVYVFSPIDARSFWVRDQLYIPWKIGERKDIHCVHMPLCDIDGNPLVPHMSKKQIRKMEQDYPNPADRAARIYGEFVTRSGMVFSSFESEVHMTDEFPIPSGWSHFWSVDPEYHRFAGLQIFVDTKGNYWITDEMFSQDEPLRKRAERMWLLTKMRKDPDRKIPVYVDSSNPQDIAELNWHFRRIGADLAAIPIPMQKNVDKMVLRVQSLMEPDDDREYPDIIPGMKDMFGAPRMFFFNTLQSTWHLEGRPMVASRLFYELTHLAYGSQGKPDKKSADGGDAADCLIYGSSILAKGKDYEDPYAWTKGMSEADVVVWQAVRMKDKMDQILGQET